MLSLNKLVADNLRSAFQHIFFFCDHFFLHYAHQFLINRLLISDVPAFERGQLKRTSNRSTDTSSSTSYLGKGRWVEFDPSVKWFCKNRRDIDLSRCIVASTELSTTVLVDADLLPRRQRWLKSTDKNSFCIWSYYKTQLTIFRCFCVWFHIRCDGFTCIWALRSVGRSQILILFFSWMTSRRVKVGAGHLGARQNFWKIFCCRFESWKCGSFSYIIIVLVFVIVVFFIHKKV